MQGGSAPRPGFFIVRIPQGVVEGQELQVRVPAGFPQEGQLSKFVVPTGALPGGMVYAPLPERSNSSAQDQHMKDVQEGEKDELALAGTKQDAEMSKENQPPARTAASANTSNSKQHQNMEIPQEWNRVKEHAETFKDNSSGAYSASTEHFGLCRFSQTVPGVDGLQGMDFNKLCQQYGSEGIARKELTQSIKALESDMAKSTALNRVADAPKISEWFPWTRLFILRDFVQAFALVFSGFVFSAALIDFQWLGVITGFANLNVGQVSPAVIIGIVVIIGFLGALGILLYFLLYCCITFPDEDKQGEATTHWEDRKHQRFWIWLTCTVIFTLYVPMGKQSFSSIFCIPPTMPEPAVPARECTEPNSDPSLPATKVECPDVLNWDDELFAAFSGVCALRFVAMILIALLVIALPCHFWRVVTRHKPATLEGGKTRNEQGEVVDFTAERYQKTITSKNFEVRPYTFLICDFKKEYAMFRIIQMVEKILLAGASAGTLAFGVRTDESIYPRMMNPGMLAMLLIQIVGAVAFWRTFPYMDQLNNIMEFGGRVTTLLISLLAFTTLGGDRERSGASTALGSLIAVLLIGNILVMFGFLLAAVPTVAKYVKQAQGRLEFDDTDKHTTSSDAGTILGWDMSREICNRIWMPVWNDLVKEAGIVPGQKKNELDERFTRIKNTVLSKGLERVREHFNGDASPAIMALRMDVINHLEGMDVCWFEETKAGLKPFGTLSVRSFPFEVVFFPESRKSDNKFLKHTVADLHKILLHNFSPDVMERRWNRRKMRALDYSMCDMKVKFFQQETRKFKVEDGTQIQVTKDKDGNRIEKVVTVYSTIYILLTFEEGKIRVNSGFDFDVSNPAHFAVSMRFKDGHGSATKPRTGQIHYENGQRLEINGDTLGVETDMRTTPTLHKLFCDNKTQWLAGIDKVQNKYDEFRDKMREQRAKETNKMSPDFWVSVYNNDGIQPDTLKRNLLRQTNEKLRRLADENPKEIEALFVRMDWVRKAVSASVWYVFWDAVWAQNQDTTAIKENAELFDTTKATAICYRPLLRHDLEKDLKKLDLYVADNKGGGVKSYLINSIKGRTRPFTDAILTNLYDKIAQIERPRGGAQPAAAPEVRVTVNAELAFEVPSNGSSASALPSPRSSKAKRTLQADDSDGASASAMPSPRSSNIEQSLQADDGGRNQQGAGYVT